MPPTNLTECIQWLEELPEGQPEGPAYYAFQRHEEIESAPDRRTGSFRDFVATRCADFLRSHLPQALDHELSARRVAAALDEIHTFQDDDARRYGPNDTIARLREILEISPLPNQISGVMVKGAYAFGYTTPAPEVSPGTAPAPDPDVERVWKEFWVPIVAPNGVIDMEQVKKELFDLHTAIENVPKVYSHITGGALSKINYLASTVIAAADDHWNESLKEERKEWEEENAEPQAEGKPLTVPGPADKPASRYGVDILYLIREISALVGTLDNRSGDEIARYLRRLADVADTAPVPEISPAPTWTREKPTEEGWYWYHQDGVKSPGISEVFPYIHGRLCMYEGDGSVIDLIDKAKWSGPIPTPTDPAQGGKETT